MTTTARTATRRIADDTADLAAVVINGIFDAIVADLDVEFEFECGICGHGTDEIFHRLTENGDEVDACETCVDTYNLGYVAD